VAEGKDDPFGYSDLSASHTHTHTKGWESDFKKLFVFNPGIKVRIRITVPYLPIMPISNPWYEHSALFGSIGFDFDLGHQY